MTEQSTVYDILLDYFQDEQVVIEFMRSFSGIVLKIPQMPTIERLAKNRQIAASLTRNPTTTTVRRLASLHGVTMRTVAKAFTKATGEGLTQVRAKQAAIG